MECVGYYIHEPRKHLYVADYLSGYHQRNFMDGMAFPDTASFYGESEGFRLHSDSTQAPRKSACV